MPIQRLKEYLDGHRVRYVTLVHSPAYTAQQVAAETHIPGRQLAKTVMVKLDGQVAMAVLPAPYRVDLRALADAARARVAQLASEEDFKELFPGCEVGAMPPFGNLWGMPVYVDETLSEDKHIAFNAGNHTEVITLSFVDFRRLVEPTIANFSSRLESRWSAVSNR